MTLTPIHTRPIGGALLILAFVALLAGCKEDVADPAPAFTGVRRTFENGTMGGTIGGDASDDWLPIPGVGVSLSPAYPNPTTGAVSVDLGLAQEDSIRLWMESAPGAFDTELLAARLTPGTHVFQFDLRGHAPRIYRLHLTVYRDGSHGTYGDIMVNP